jgi:hypothetical protein
MPVHLRIQQFERFEIHTDVGTEFNHTRQLTGTTQGLGKK